MKKAQKASHLSYLGDSQIGAEANIGAGTITCNYDGQNKYQTIIGAGAFIGSNSSLVAPVQIGDNALIGAGSVITSNVDADALSLARAEQRTIKQGKTHEIKDKDGPVMTSSSLPDSDILTSAIEKSSQLVFWLLVM